MSAKQIILLGFILILALFASACGGEAGEQIASNQPNDNTPGHSIGDGETDDSGGIGGSGRAAHIIGPITAVDNTITTEGMNKITVGGIAWEYDDERVNWRDIFPPGEPTLKVGMVVEIWGSTNPPDGEGTAGDAFTINVISAVSGPIETIGEVTVMVMGQQVVVTDQTIFDPDNVSPPSMSGLAVGEHIVVYGSLNGENIIEASLIQKYAWPPDLRAVSGIVVQMNIFLMQVGQLVADTKNAFKCTTTEYYPPDFEIYAGDRVWIIGEMNERNSDFNASLIIKTKEPIEENEYLDIAGMLFYTANPNFRMWSAMGDIYFVIDDQTVFHDGLTTENIAPYDHIRLKGTFKNGVVWAEEIYDGDN